jgi:hypothetical protein
MFKFKKNVGVYGQTKKVLVFLFSFVEAHNVQSRIAELTVAEK